MGQIVDIEIAKCLGVSNTLISKMRKALRIPAYDEDDALERAIEQLKVLHKDFQEDSEDAED